jgi:hypothetical protein
LTNQLYLEVCKLAVCQWKFQKKVFLGLTKNSEPMDRVESRRKVEMPGEHTQRTSSKGMVLTDATSGKERAPTSTDTGDLSGKRWKSVFYDQGGNAVPGKCLKCKADFLGPPNDRLGEDSTKTWFKSCGGCHMSRRKKTSCGMSSGTRRTQQVDISLTDDGPSDYKGAEACTDRNVISDCEEFNPLLAG